MKGTLKIHLHETPDMMIQITRNRSILEVQQDFNRQYPFLKLEFYKNNASDTRLKRQHILSSVPVSHAGLTRNGNIELNDLMTVGQLENIFRTEFGLSAQVSRKSGTLWLETTMTDGWTLKQQNDHGKELSEPVKKQLLLNEPGQG